jgi:NifU-like protein involved in Fe-S cluster formation
MSKINELFNSKIHAINVGIEFFKDDILKQNANATHLDWTPPGGGKPELIAALDKLENPAILEKIEAANKLAVERIITSQPVLVGFDQAINVVPGMTKTTILHAGPPITWDKMNGPMRGAITGAIVFEGLASNLEEAEKLAASGEITFSPCHEHNCVGSMAGVTSASMFMHVVENKTYGNIAYTNLSEQLSKILRMGANDESVINRLNWMRDVLGPMLREAMKLNPEGIDLRLMLAQALHMGDECHNRNVAGTTLLIQALSPYLLETDFTIKQKREVLDFVASSDYFSGPTWMALAKCALDAAHGIENSTIVTTMARNGTEFGIRVSGMAGNTWFTGPAQKVIGPMFAGYKPEDSGLDIGDSAITETYGIGGFAMATAPAIVALVGGTVEEAIAFSTKMKEITTAENPNVTIPLLNFMGIPTGIDVRKVIQTGIMPVINTAIAHKEAGIGMIGAGITYPPVEAYEKALLALSENIN